MPPIAHRLLVDLALVGKRLERGDRHVMPVYLEEAAQFRARVAAAIAIRAQHRVAAGYPLPNLIRDGFYIVGAAMKGPWRSAKVC